MVSQRHRTHALTLALSTVLFTSIAVEAKAASVPKQYTREELIKICTELYKTGVELANCIEKRQIFPPSSRPDGQKNLGALDGQDSSTVTVFKRDEKNFWDVLLDLRRSLLGSGS